MNIHWKQLAGACLFVAAVSCGGADVSGALGASSNEIRGAPAGGAPASTPPTRECAKAECGPAMGMPNWQCDDGEVGGPRCEFNTRTGHCGWVINNCSPARTGDDSTDNAPADGASPGEVTDVGSGDEPVDDDGEVIEPTGTAESGDATVVDVGSLPNDEPDCFDDDGVLPNPVHCADLDEAACLERADCMATYAIGIGIPGASLPGKTFGGCADKPRCE